MTHASPAPHPAARTLILRDLGGLSLERDGRRIAGPAANQPGRLAVLAVIAASGVRGVSRDRLLALFWPDSDTERARGALNQALYALRRDTGEQALTLGTAVLRLNPDVVRSDAAAFEAALDAGELETAAGLYLGPFLDGVYVDASAEFDRWVEARREHLARRHAEAAAALAARATAAGDHDAAIRWWRTLAALDPLDSRTARNLVQALAAAGDRTAALQHASRHQEILRAELGVGPDPALDALVTSLRTESPQGQGTKRLPPIPKAPAPPADAVVSPATARPSPSPPPSHERGRRGRDTGVVAAAAVAVAAAAALLGQLPRSDPAVVPGVVRPVANSTIVEFQPALAPDGKSVAFVVGTPGTPRRVAIRSTAGVPSGVEARAAGDTSESQWLPSWSPDGESVRFLACPGPELPVIASACTWRQTSRLGGAAHDLELPRVTGTEAWSPDGAMVAFSSFDTLFRYSVADRKVSLVAVQRPFLFGLHSIAWSPDGKWLAYVNGNIPWRGGHNVDQASIWIVPAAGGTPVQITENEAFATSPVWHDGRHLLYVSDRNGVREIYRVAVGADGPAGDPVHVPGGADAHSIAYATAGRVLAHARYVPRQNIWAYPLDGDAPMPLRRGRPVTAGNQIIETHDASPDGRWLAFDSDAGGDMDLYKLPLGGGPPIRLTQGGGNEFRPRWSADGREIVFYGGTGRLNVLMIPSAGGRPSVATSLPGVDPIWAPRGAEIVFRRSKLREIWRITRDAPGAPWRPPTLVAETESACPPEDWRPDATGFLCPTDAELRVLSRDGRVLWRREIPERSGIRCPGPRFSPSGAEIYCLMEFGEGGRGLWATPVDGGPPRLIVADDDAAARMTGDVSVGLDELFLTIAEADADIWVMTLEE